MNCFVALNRSASRLEFSEALLAGATIDFLLSAFRDADAAKRLFRKALGDRSHPQPSRTALAAEVLFLRKQLAYYRDHQIRPRRLSEAARFTTDGSQILAPATGWDPAETDLLAALENVPQESCPRDLDLRFSGCRDGPVPGAVRLSRDGSRQPPYSALQRDRASHRRLDTAAVPGSHSQ